MGVMKAGVPLLPDPVDLYSKHIFNGSVQIIRVLWKVLMVNNRHSFVLQIRLTPKKLKSIVILLVKIVLIDLF